MIHIYLKNIKKYFGGNEILKDITFDVQIGEKVGIIGRNGTGKTTLFKLINQVEKHDGGDISIKKDTRIGYLDQIPIFSDDYLVIDVLNTAFEEEFRILGKMRQLEVLMADSSTATLDGIMKKYSILQQEFLCLGGYEIDEKLSRICNGLKISEELKSRHFSSLSGGEKTTILLGKILLKSCDLLLLDEPSNHLDMESIEWLEKFITDYEGTVIVISHDRYFLDKTVNKIIEIEDGVCEVYLGNYSYYVEEKNRRLIEMLEDYKNQQKKIKSMEEAAKRFKDWGNRGDNPKFHRKAASILKKIEKLEKIKKPILDRRKIQVEFTSKELSGKDVVKIHQISKAFNNTTILSKIDLHIYKNDKVSILGKNGAGKSTLFKLITGEYLPDEGKILIGNSTKVGYLQQNITFNDLEMSVLEAFRSNLSVNEGEARSILAQFLFYDEDVFKKVGTLSGGEKSRLRLCQLMHQDVNTLILDEPTNHLDIESREMLEDALKDFDGTVIFVSHDRYFINMLAEKVFEIKDSKITEYVGNYDYYKEKQTQTLDLISHNQSNYIKKTVEIKEKHSSRQGKDKPKSIKIDVNAIEDKIEALEKQITLIDEDMLNNASNYAALESLQITKDKLQQELDILLEKWMNYNH
ncbi:ribosomal protection-like ABC-F family protein [Alkaliphilus peptidifermentans]|uniref:ATPase components of ABC transporters with duplicated ATPase domains n=1 Tax=Alkaliphilus peptidifermentans DSM 18978 TaxID=1120976 RepID=A0A1G5F1Q6_9FIRM|nr:ABC-F family ATP-binding cassette domain-containing protein [Alkaliphilus peptidifermentans]SCY33185.1 ATPase components of ABC transporters with duplicated ATPase domains [Alkaliphilus peptidifermentans DSM 18978]